MDLHDLTYRFRDQAPTCAACGTRVTAVEAVPSHFVVDDRSSIFASDARCRLRPCGHTFVVASGGLIH